MGLFKKTSDGVQENENSLSFVCKCGYSASCAKDEKHSIWIHSIVADHKCS
jgi:hypothetical protein